MYQKVDGGFRWYEYVVSGVGAGRCEAALWKQCHQGTNHMTKLPSSTGRSH
jgi:hypothetical protein